VAIESATEEEALNAVGKGILNVCVIL
jgi:hypothetical protein